MNFIGIDFEDWFHPELVAPFIPPEKKIPIMYKGLEKILDLLRRTDSIGTFFLVGETLKNNPEILDMILSSGHEIGFHTMNHRRLDLISNKIIFQNELKEFKKLTRNKSKGFRAPTFSLNKKSAWIIDELIKNNYKYDSSVVPAKTSMYGIPNADIAPYKISSTCIEKNDDSSSLMEFPLMITNFFIKRIPSAGGFYLRSLPLRIVKNSILSYEKQNIPASMYIHSWELTPEYFPKINLPFKNNFITFYNIKNTYTKLFDILKTFEFKSFESYF